MKALVSVFKQLWPAYLLGSILVLYGFTWGLPDGRYHGYAFQIDETAAVVSINRISFPAFNPQFLLWGTGLFYQVYLVKTIVTVAGQIPMDSYWVYVIGRLISYTSAMGAITITFLLGRKLFDAWTGRGAALLLAVLPGFAINSHYFKTDVPMTFWLLAALYVAYRVSDSGRLITVLLMGFLVGYSASVKYSAGVVLASGLVAIAMAKRDLNKGVAFIAYAACAAAGFLFGTPYALLDVRSFMDYVQVQANLQRLATSTCSGLPPAFIDVPIHVLPYSLTMPVLVATACALIWVTCRNSGRLAIVWIFLILYGLLLMTMARLVRYTIPLLPFAALFVACLASSMRKVRVLRWFAAPAMGALAIYAFVFTLSYVQVMGQEDPRVQASRWIERNVPRDAAVPVVSDHYANLPDLPLLGYKALDVQYSIVRLQESTSPYLIESEYGTRFYEQVIDCFPEQKQFFHYVGTNYVEVARFENSQVLFGVDSKSGDVLPQDWLHANPRITILKRR